MAKRTFDTVWRDVRKTVASFFKGDGTSKKGDDDYSTDMLKEGDELVGPRVKSLFEDAIKYRKAIFSQTKDSRYGYSDPIAFARDMLKLEGGNHWEVYGRRNDGIANDWKQEDQDDETSDQIRARNAWLNGNWHDIEISPNINYMDSILQQEREKTDWGRNMRRLTKQMQMLGMVDVVSVLDKNRDERGLAMERVMPYGSVLYSPFSTGKYKDEGCTYAVIADTVNRQWVKRAYEKFDMDKLSSITGRELQEFVLTENAEDTPRYDHTEVYPRLTCYMDDGCLEQAKFSEKQFISRVGDLLEGLPVEPDVEQDDHEAWMGAYDRYAKETYELAHPPEEEDVMMSLAEEQMLAALLDLLNDQMMKHVEASEKKTCPPSMRRKYPFGRCIVTICDEVAEDKPNPYEFDWRHLVHRAYNEEVPGRTDGRGDVEILRNVQKNLDKGLSRFGDSLVISAHGKPWFHASEKDEVEKSYNNNPTKPGFYKKQAPVFAKPPISTENVELWKIHKENAQRKLGVNAVTYGEAPTRQASGDLAEIMTQNQSVVITGEANQNIADLVKDLIETRLKMWKKFYTEPRFYVVKGQEEAVIVSELLGVHEAEDEVTGEKVSKPIESFEVTVRPGSNQPQKWERQLSMMMTLYGMVGPDGMPLIPAQLVLDLVAERYPQVNDPRYKMLSQAMQVGMQVMQAQQEREEIRGKEAGDLKNKLRSAGMNAIMRPRSNGQSQVERKMGNG